MRCRDAGSTHLGDDVVKQLESDAPGVLAADGDVKVGDCVGHVACLYMTSLSGGIGEWMKRYKSVNSGLLVMKFEQLLCGPDRPPPRAKPNARKPGLRAGPRPFPAMLCMHLRIIRSLSCFAGLHNGRD